jgi:hypothetical protein
LLRIARHGAADSVNKLIPLGTILVALVGWLLLVHTSVLIHKNIINYNFNINLSSKYNLLSAPHGGVNALHHLSLLSLEHSRE